MPKFDNPEDIQVALDGIKSQVHELGTKAMGQVEKNGTMTLELKGQVDTALTTIGELSAKMSSTQQELVAMRDAKGAVEKAQKSAGETFTESEQFVDWLKTADRRKSVSVPIKLKAITSAVGSAGTGVAPDFRGDIISLGRRRFTIRDLMLAGRTSGNAVTYVRESGYTNASAPVSETVRKPESSLTLEQIIAPVITLASYMKASNQIMSDVPQLQSYIDGRLRYGLSYAEELQLLKGSGTGQNLTGIYTVATAYTQPTGAVVTGTETKIDRIRLMMLQAYLAEFPPTGIVLHPTDWASIELLKDTQARYLVGSPSGELGPRLWGLPVVETQAMTVNTALVGAFKPMSQIFDREDVNVVIATENEDDFVKNLVTIRCEERLADAIYRNEAFVKSSLAGLG